MIMNFLLNRIKCNLLSLLTCHVHEIAWFVIAFLVKAYDLENVFFMERLFFYTI